MSLQAEITTAMKEAMKAKDTVALEALRAIKSELLLAQTESGSTDTITEEQEIKILQKLVKQRKDSATIYKEQGREDLAEPELAQATVIERFLPEQASVEEIEKIVVNVIEQGGFSGMAAMGQVMGMVTKELAGKADGKTISAIVKNTLAK